jgi:putative tryptophan/tyrosine transport system substrate-binding protein
MKNFPKIIFVLLVLPVFLLSACHKKENNAIRIGIVLPIEHKAMREITYGFENKLTQIYKKPVIFKVANAEGDPNLMRAIIMQMRDAGYDFIVPVGTATTQMAAALVQKQQLIGLAAEYSEKMRQVRHPCNIGIVDDELNNTQIIAFIHAAYPALKNLSIVYSAADKIFPEVEAVKQAASNHGITLHRIMVQNLTDLYSAANAMPKDTQTIFILKDNLIASGIDTLSKIAHERKIPLITSDDGTVQAGAGFALGVREQQIGEEGAKLAATVLSGATICKLPIVKMTKPTLFINPKALTACMQKTDAIAKVARAMGYPIEVVNK